MDRKAFFNRKTEHKSTAKKQEIAMTVNGLQPYLGEFDFNAARHLLTRTNFGANLQWINQATSDGLEATLDKILTPFVPSTLPINPSYADDPNVAIGETWIDKPFAGPIEAIFYRKFSLFSWNTSLMNLDNISVQEKMTLFWHNHFAIHDINDGRFGYEYVSTLRSHALGNFKDLVKAICIDPMMLLFLNGNENIGTSPNENFARELLELFTIGKGDLIGPGDYTNYTEHDIFELARVFTGWKYEGRYATDDTLPGAVFRFIHHDYEDKIFSDKFNGKVIEGTGEDEYLKAVDMIFEKEEVANFICRKVYQWFVNFEITAEVEANVIQPLAAILRAEDYEMKPMLQALFCSDYFMSEDLRGCQIKNPIDFIMGINQTFNIEFESSFEMNYPQMGVLNGFAGLLQMKYFDPPSVAGWKAYYQEPLFYQTWINSVTLPYRNQYVDAVAGDGVTIFGTALYKIDVLKLSDSLDTPQFINPLLDQLIALVFPKPLSSSQVSYLKETLLGDLDDVEWEINYSQYLIDPSNIDNSIPIERRLRILLTTMMSLAEFHLM